MRYLLNKRYIWLAIFSLCCVSFNYAQVFTDKIYVQLRDTAAIEEIRQIDQEIGWKRIFPYSPRFEKRHKENGLHLWYKTDKVYTTNRMEELVNVIRKMAKVEQAFLPYHMEQQDENKSVIVDSKQMNTRAYLPVNDPLYHLQWHFQNRSLPGGIDINLEKAWQLEKGCRDVIVAIMDKPFDPYHEDYKDNVWVNEEELNGLENVDDDGNGYVDDVYGYDSGSDIGAHGTHVAGVIGAINNNGLGVCGIAGGDSPLNGVRIMRCDVPLNDFAGETCAQAFVYAADHGAVISQNSYSIISSPLVSFGINYFMKTAGDYAGSPMKGGLVVWAAGNDNITTHCSPIDEPSINRENLIVVSSVGPNGGKACYSNYGDWINIAAPGGEYGSPTILSTLPDNKYGFMEGTSMACPHVSGIAALVVSKFKGNITPTEVKHRILTSVNDVNRHVEGQTSWHLMGNGIVDAWKALLDKEGKAPSAIPSMWAGKSSMNLIELCWKLPAESDKHMVDSCRIFYSQFPFTVADRNVSSITIPTNVYGAGDTLRHQFTDLQAGQPYYFRIQGKDRWDNLADLSQMLSVTKRPSLPIIYGEYMYNRFNLYLQSQDNVFSPDPLLLNYKVQAPVSMEMACRILDKGKAIHLLSFENNEIKLKLDPIGNITGVYEAQIIVEDVLNPVMADTLFLSYKVTPPLHKASVITPLFEGVSLDFVVPRKEGTMIVNLNDYVADPLHLDVYFEYDKRNNVDASGFGHGVFAELKGSLLYINYEFVDDDFSWEPMENKIVIPFDALTRMVDSRETYDITIRYEEPMGVESITEGNVCFNEFKQRFNIPAFAQIQYVNVYSVSGNKVGQLYPNSSLNLSFLKPGYYLIQVVTRDKTYVRKIGITND